MDEVADLADLGETDALFSRSAPNNAEVVPPSEIRTGDGLWTVSANRTAPDETGIDDLHGASVPPVPPPFGRLYRSPIGSSRTETVDPVGDNDDLWSDASDTRYGEVFNDSQDSATVADTGPVGDVRWEQPAGESTWNSESDDFEDTTFVDAPDTDDPGPYDSVSDDATWAEDDPITGGSARYDDTYTGSTGGIHDTVGSVFRAEPVSRAEDVIEEGDYEVVNDPPISSGPSQLFSSGGPRIAGEMFAGADTFTVPRDPNLWQGQTHITVDDPGDSRVNNGGAARTEMPNETVEEDSPGFLSAIGRLSIAERERATVPLLVAGALLAADEEVLGLVVGQMLGRPAVMVLCPERVLVVNDRKWQPVVDEYQLDTELEIRGRHDRNVAAIGVSDDTGLSMVDGIFDVQSAMNMVARIRSIVETGAA